MDELEKIEFGIRIVREQIEKYSELLEQAENSLFDLKARQRELCPHVVEVVDEYTFLLVCEDCGKLLE